MPPLQGPLIKSLRCKTPILLVNWCLNPVHRTLDQHEFCRSEEQSFISGAKNLALCPITSVSDSVPVPVARLDSNQHGHGEHHKFPKPATLSVERDAELLSTLSDERIREAVLEYVHTNPDTYPGALSTLTNSSRCYQT